jgi:hypothetical protein
MEAPALDLECAACMSEVRPGLAERLLAPVRGRLRTDPVLAAELAEFMPGEWEPDGAQVVCRLGDRWCRVSADEIALGNDRWPGSKRIPLR